MSKIHLQIDGETVEGTEGEKLLWVALDAGIDNLFDKAYANHLNRANAFDPVQVQVNEPGRSFWARLTATF